MVRTNQLLSGVTATQAIGAAIAVQKKSNPRVAFVASGKTTGGAGTATVLVEATNDDPSITDPAWVTVATLSLTLATTKGAGVSGAYATDASYRAFRMRVTAITGTGAAIDGVGSESSN